MSGAFREFVLAPDYARGVGFSWLIENTFAEPLPWSFQVEASELPVAAPWLPIGEPAVNVMSTRADPRRIYPGAPVQFYRVKLTTPEGVHYSAVQCPYNKLTRQEWCIVRTMMEDAARQYTGPGGVPLQLWNRAVYGADCSCANAVTGETENSGCRLCFGTGKALGYVGPTDIVGTLSARVRHTRVGQDEAATAAEPRAVEMVANVVLRSRDVIVNTATGARFVVGEVRHMAEIRGVPILYSAQLATPSMSDPIYRIGSA